MDKYLIYDRGLLLDVKDLISGISEKIDLGNSRESMHKLNL